MIKTLNFLKRPFCNCYASGDTDEATAGAKGMRWVIVAVLIIMTVVGVLFANSTFKGAYGRVKTQVQKLFTVFDDISDNDTSLE